VVSLLIRPAAISDADPIARVFLAARRTAMPWLPILHTDAETRWWIRTKLLTTGTVWIAETAGTVVGFAALNAGVLEHLYVHPDVWDRQIGTQLLDRVRAEPLDTLTLYVFQRNVRARRFYEAQGFKLRSLGTGTTNEEREPDACYTWHRPDPVAKGE
jgi:ribosomal protein S18 acetylase RimI-like enzyme